MQDSRGQVLVEFALVSMVFFMLVFAVLDLARFFESWISVQGGAREGARFAITGKNNCAGYSNDRYNCAVDAAKTGTTGLFGGGLGGSGVTVSITSWPHQPGGTFGSPVSSSVGNQCDKIEVDVSYTHKFVLPFLSVLSPGGITLTGKQTMLNEPFGPC